MQRSHVALQTALEELLQRVMSHVQGEAMRQLAELDLSFTQARIVFALAHVDDPLTINEIAGHVGLSVAAAGRNVDDLVGLGVVQRTENPLDRRVKHVTLSEHGLAIADTHFEQKRAALGTLVRQVPADLADHLTAALRPVLDGDCLRSPDRPRPCVPDSSTTSELQEPTHVH